MLREGLEAALIVSLIASYLKRTQRGNWIGVSRTPSR
jgi:high-affinity iron transporter